MPKQSRDAEEVKRDFQAKLLRSPQALGIARGRKGGEDTSCNSRLLR
jgi:hypothetical protein